MCSRCTVRASWVKGMCQRCYYATRRGTDTHHERKQRRNFVRGALGVLTTAKGNEFFVDLDDFAACREYLWNDCDGYAKSDQVGYLHRFLLPECSSVDHINRDTRDNRRSNLRDGSRGVNARNKPVRTSRSGWRGVSECKGRWQACITVHGVRHRGGTFDTPEEAAARVHELARTHGVEEFYPAP